MVLMQQINSMTGFIRHLHSVDDGSYVWEIRSLNHKFCEVNLNLPKAYRHYDFIIRKIIKQFIQRGKVDVTLEYLPTLTSVTDFNDDNIKILEEKYLYLKNKLPNLGELSFETSLNYLHTQRYAQHLTDKEAEVVTGLRDAMHALGAIRAQEGFGLAEFCQTRIDKILDQYAVISKLKDQSLVAYKSSLANKINALMLSVTPERLEQELLLFAEKVDISEELHRLSEHLINFQAILHGGGVIGRKLDFVTQELIREANTIGAKVNNVDIAKIVIEIKLLIEQLREQIQNIE